MAGKRTRSLWRGLVLHETSIALGILALVEDVYKETPRAKSVSRIKLRIGMLSLLDIDSLVFTLKVAAKGTPAENARIEYTIEQPEFRCKKCGYVWRISVEELNNIVEEHDLRTVLHLYPDTIAKYLYCPKCGSIDVEVLRGRGVVLESVEIETEPS